MDKTLGIQLSSDGGVSFLNDLMKSVEDDGSISYDDGIFAELYINQYFIDKFKDDTIKIIC